MSKNTHYDFSEVKCRWKPVIMDYTLATKLLDNLHPNQRNPKRGKIEQYCSDMLDGKWQFSPHECIGVDVDGFTMNGQNRLLAWQKAYSFNKEIQIPFVICYGVPTESIIVTDTGAGRTVNDAAKAQGLDFSNKSFASVARRMYDGGCAKNRSSISIQKTLDIIDDYEDALTFVFTHLKKNTKGLTQASVRAVVARAFYSRSKKRLEQFCEMLLSGLIDDRNIDSAVITLRNFLLENESQVGRRKGVSEVYGIVELCLDAFLNKYRVFELKPVPKELFPIESDKRRNNGNTEDQS